MWFKTDIKMRYYFAVIIGMGIYYAIISWNPIQWGDSAYYLNRIQEGPIYQSSLHPMAHHGFQMIAKITYIFGGLQAILIFNSFFLLGSLLLMHQLTRLITINTKPNVIYFLGFIFLHAVAWTSTHIEVYTIHLFLYLSGLYFLLKGNGSYYVLSGFFFGLSLLCHQMTFLVLPILIWWIWQHKSKKACIYFALGVLSTLTVLVPSFWKFRELGLVDEIKLYLTGSSLKSEGWIKQLFSLNSFSVANLIFLAVAFLSVFNPAFYVFLKNKSTTPEQKLLHYCAWMMLFFALSYQVSDKFTFLLPFLASISILAAAYDNHWSMLHHAKILLIYLLPIGISFSIYALQIQLKGSSFNLKNTKLRNEFTYYGLPWIKDESAQEFAFNYLNFTKSEYPIYADYNVASCLLNAKHLIPAYNKTIILSRRKQILQQPDTIYYLPRLTEIDTSLFKKIKPMELGFIGYKK